MKFKILILLCFSFILSGIFSGCFQKQKTMIVGLEDSYPPFAFKKNNEPAGFDVDLISAIAENIDYKVVFKTMPFSEIEKALEEGKIDIAAGGFSSSPKRSEKFIFSDSYYKPNFCIIYKKSKFSGDFSKIEDIKFDAKIGAQKETVIIDFLNDFLSKKRLGAEISVVPYENNFDMVYALKNNEINFFITEDLQAEVLSQNSQDLAFFTINENTPDLPKEPYVFAFNKKNKKLAKIFNTEMRALEESGKIDILKLRWFSTYGMYENMLR